MYISEKPSKERWQQNAESFEAMWNFPNCIGAIDGKHVQIKKPKNGGSKWINYKGTHSVVLMAVARADYTFEYVDVGGFGRQSDGGNWQNCTLGRALGDGELVLPPGRKPPLCAEKLPYVFVADAAFPMSENLLRPYPGYALSSLGKQERIFNYRLSRARRVVENAFGILAAEWEILRGPIALEP
ncbi:hypothetical protein RvY_03256-1 [Ramazzottius varieornatus]|uniref:DDE Tnp4 domain-containing protein n=1 Tax=Ramazzottius varieornatus TaxID=947166 RepID=A0A1D1UT62_RAMVA|nr:hypothetical protein RvY_03256-1 [Ramazzottius varieornatus]